MKPKPAYVANLSIDNAVFAQIYARVLSVEECISRIFGLDFCVHDIKCIHQSGAPPELRNAMYNYTGNQVHINPVGISYHRLLKKIDSAKFGLDTILKLMKMVSNDSMILFIIIEFVYQIL